MSLHTPIVTGKRKAEDPLPTPDAKKAAVAPIDLYPLFATVSNAIIPGEDGKVCRPEKIARRLSRIPEVLFPFGQLPLQKIEDQFNIYFSESDEADLHKKAITKTLKGLYQISLVNSQTPVCLAQKAEQLPTLKKMLEGNIKEDIQNALQQAEALLEEKDETKFLQNVDETSRRLNQFRELRQHLDYYENRRIMDLATLNYNKREPKQYPAVISDYPRIVLQIEMLSEEITDASQMFQKLVNLKMQLQKPPSPVKPQGEETLSLETRFLKAYGPTFYKAFGQHFWTLVWNSLSEEEILNMLCAIPGWQDSQLNEVDYAVINAIWNKYLPDHDFPDWMLRTLESLKEEERGTLERHLQDLSKHCTEIHESQDLDKSTKTEMIQFFQNEMFSHCYNKTVPQFSNLPGLKVFLHT